MYPLADHAKRGSPRTQDPGTKVTPLSLMMVIGAETFALQSRKARPAIWVTKHQGRKTPKIFWCRSVTPSDLVRAAATFPLS
jgi:hypothetical protein